MSSEANFRVAAAKQQQRGHSGQQCISYVVPGIVVVRTLGSMY